MLLSDKKRVKRSIMEKKSGLDLEMWVDICQINKWGKGTTGYGTCYCAQFPPSGLKDYFLLLGVLPEGSPQLPTVKSPQLKKHLNQGHAPSQESPYPVIDWCGAKRAQPSHPNLGKRRGPFQVQSSFRFPGWLAKAFVKMHPSPTSLSCFFPYPLQWHSLINLLHTSLHLKVCFLGIPEVVHKSRR